jgi:hypothetical protein
MATWVRNGTGTLPSAIDTNMTGTVELDNATAPGDFDPAAVNSVRIQYRTQIQSGSFTSPEDHTVLRTVDLTLNGVGLTIAEIGGANTDLDNATDPVDTDETDSSVNQAQTAAAWEGAELNPTDVAGALWWTDYNQNMGKDGVTIELVNVVVTIDYTAGGATTSGILNGGGSIASTVISNRTTVAGTLNGGGSIAETVATVRSAAVTLNGGGSLSSSQTAQQPSATTIVELKLDPGSAPFETGFGRTVKFIRMRTSSANLDDAEVTWALYQGTTLIVQTASFGLTQAFQTYFLPLTNGQESAITDWTDLRIRASLSDPTGDIGDYEIADMWLSYPEASAQPTAAGTLNGGGSISATVEHVGDADVTLNGGGSITAAADQVHSTTGVLNGGGSITAAFTKAVERTATLNGGGSITAVTDQVQSVAAELNGGGSISEAHAKAVDRVAELNGGGSITAAFAKAVERTATLNGGGSIAATAEKGSETKTTSGILNGGGSIAAAFAKAVERAAILNGGGSIAATTDMVQEAAVELNGGGSISAVVSSARENAETLNGGGSITGAASQERSVAATLHGGGSISATVSHAGTTASLLNGGGSITAAAEEKQSVAVELNGGGSIAPVVVSAREKAVTLNGGGSITAIATKDVAHEASGILNGGGSISATVASNRTSVAVELNGGGTVTAGDCVEISKAGITPTAYRTRFGVPGNAIDDDFDTEWTAENNGDTPWIKFDMGTDVRVSEIDYHNGEVPWGATGELNLQYSTDDVVWNLASIITSLNYNDIRLGWDAGNFTARYFRLIRLNWSMREIAFYTCNYIVGAHNTTAELNGGGSINATASQGDAHTAVAELNGGGSISATVETSTKPVTAVLNGGGSITWAVTGHHWTRSFPDLGEGLQGPALNGGGSIAATATPVVAPNVQAVLNGGGSITATISGGDRIYIKPGGSASPKGVAGRAKGGSNAGQAKVGGQSGKVSARNVSGRIKQ